MYKYKFRGLSTSGEFIYGSLVITTHGISHKPKNHTKTWIITSSFGNGGWFNVVTRKYVLPNTVGQFTGLLDKHDTEIYEGDIVKYIFDHDENNNPLYCTLTVTTICEIIEFRNSTSSLEVVGNIHIDTN